MLNINAITVRLGGRLILDRATPLTDMPWVGHRARNWEPEPLRYLASKAIVTVLGSADRVEDARGGRARRTRLVSPFLMGH